MSIGPGVALQSNLGLAQSKLWPIILYFPSSRSRFSCPSYSNPTNKQATDTAELAFTNDSIPTSTKFTWIWFALTKEQKHDRTPNSLAGNGCAYYNLALFRDEDSNQEWHPLTTPGKDDSVSPRQGRWSVPTMIKEECLQTALFNSNMPRLSAHIRQVEGQ